MPERNNTLGRWPVLILCALILVCAACTQANGMDPKTPVTYSEIIIDTYDPAGTGAPAPNNTYMELWSSDPNETVPLATQDGQISNPRPVAGDLSHGYPYIAAAGLVSGDYYALVRESFALNDTFDYSIRVLTSWTDYTGWQTTTVAGNSSDLPKNGPPVPANNYPTITYSGTTNDKMRRTIAGNDVTWVRIHLP